MPVVVILTYIVYNIKKIPHISDSLIISIVVCMNKM